MYHFFGVIGTEQRDRDHTPIIESPARQTRRKEWLPSNCENLPEPHYPPRHDRDHAPTSGTFINFEDGL